MTTPTKRLKRIPETFTDTDGIERVRIALREPGTFAVLDLDDAAAWTEAGLTWQWGLDRDGYVVVGVTGKGATPVSRLLLAAVSGERVSYVDGDRCNLRRCNLRITRAGEAELAVEAFHTQQAARRAAEEVRVQR